LLLLKKKDRQASDYVTIMNVSNNKKFIKKTLSN